MFIADLHLQTGDDDLGRLATLFLTDYAHKADHLFILGDLVEYWIGDDADDGRLDVIFNAIANLHKLNTKTWIMHGNRDFLLGQSLARRLNATLIADDFYLLRQADYPILLMHGDTLCTDDIDYQKMRSQFRDPIWQQSFLAKTVTERQAFAESLRIRSQADSQNKSDTIMDVNDNAVIATMQHYRVNHLIHGHTHRPGEHDLSLEGHAAKRWVLGDWKPDSAIYGELAQGSMQLRQFTLNAAP